MTPLRMKNANIGCEARSWQWPALPERHLCSYAHSLAGSNRAVLGCRGYCVVWWYKGWDEGLDACDEEKGWYDGGEKSKGRRVSIGGFGQGEVVSSGMVDMMQGMGLTEEPEDVSDEEEGVEAEGNVDNEDLPTWAKRSSFVDDELGENASTQQHRIFLTVPAGRAHAVITAFLPGIPHHERPCDHYIPCTPSHQCQRWSMTNDNVSEEG
jgi:hypothetical protein